MDTESLREYGASHTQAWALLTLKAMSTTGLSPSSNRIFHRLIYFANSLARLYAMQPPAEIVMRHPRGPFYPRAQNDLDRLCVMRLASVKNYRLKLDNNVVQRLGDYDITENGFRLANLLGERMAWARGALELLLDLTVAFATSEQDFIDRAEEIDLTYGAPSAEENAVISFREYQRNLSLRATRTLESLVPSPLRPIPQQSLRLYVRYLERLAA